MLHIKYLILDRDGTIIVDKHYLKDPAQVELLPGAGEGLARLAKCGIKFYLATNQSGIGRGYFSLDDHHAVQKTLEKLLIPYGVYFEEMAFCPHTPEDGCPCRKPALGMWESLVKTHGLCAEHAVMIGDKQADIDMGINAGLKATVLVQTGKGEKTARDCGLPLLTDSWQKLTSRQVHWPHIQAKDLEAACHWVYTVALKKNL